MTRLPCPRWCVTDHREDLPDEINDIVVHSSTPIKVPVMGEDGTNSRYRYAYACASQADGETADVFISAGGEELSAANACRLAAAILDVVDLIGGAA
jgi:hypothetical protein